MVIGSLFWANKKTGKQKRRNADRRIVAKIGEMPIGKKLRPLRIKKGHSKGQMTKK